MDMDASIAIEPVQQHEISELLQMKWDIFGAYYPTREACDTYTLASVDWNISVKLVYERKAIGMYLLKSEPVSHVSAQEQMTTLYEDLSKYSDLRGIQGVTLTLQEDYRGRGWGNLLKEYPRTLGYDYWWCIAFKALGNLRDWQKRARLVGEGEFSYLLLEDFR